MTTQKKIEVLEKAVLLIDTNDPLDGPVGICYAVQLALNDGPLDATHWLLFNCDIKLKPKRFGLTRRYCWPLTSEGDEQRRSFLRGHITRLRKEL